MHHFGSGPKDSELYPSKCSLFHCLKSDHSCSGAFTMEQLTMTLGTEQEKDGKNLSSYHLNTSHTDYHVREKCTSAQLLWLAKLL